MNSKTAAHLSDRQVEEIGRRLDAMRAGVVDNLGEEDAAYIRRMIKVQRSLEIAARTTLMASILPPAWLAGTAMLGTSKILENMELGHNIMHGQWDWMRDPAIHSTTWEWDSAISSEEWKKSHNVMHHTWTNVIGKDLDVGYGRLRVSKDQEWEPSHSFQLITNVVIMLMFEYGIAMYDADQEVAAQNDGKRDKVAALKSLWRKVKPQVIKDYVAFPLLSGISAPTTLTANVSANVMRNIWTHVIIFCGHFPEDVEYFTEEQIEGETRGQWYIRQLQGSANIEGSPLFHIMSGNLSHQIEHHLFPDIPSNHYAEIAPQVRALCEEYGLPYTSGRLSKQSAEVWRKLAIYSVPNDFVSGIRSWLRGGPAAQAVRSSLAEAAAIRESAAVADTLEAGESTIEAGNSAA